MWAGTPSLPPSSGPWGRRNVQGCASIPVPPERRAFPDREVTICAASPFPGPAAPGLAHLQHLLGNPTSPVPPWGKVQSLSSPCSPHLQSPPTPTNSIRGERSFCSPVGPLHRAPQPPHRSVQRVSASLTAVVRTRLSSPGQAAHACRTHQPIALGTRWSHGKP